MTTQEKFYRLIMWYDKTNGHISLQQSFFMLKFILNKTPSINGKSYLKLHKLEEKYRISENWDTPRLTNGKILMVELIYKQFKKDGLI